MSSIDFMSKDIFLEFESDIVDVNQEQSNAHQFDNLKYCSFCGSVPYKMKNHVKAHKLRLLEEYLEAFKYY